MKVGGVRFHFTVTGYIVVSDRNYGYRFERETLIEFFRIQCER